jgi:hypothetical protein
MKTYIIKKVCKTKFIEEHSFFKQLFEKYPNDYKMIKQVFGMFDHPPSMLHRAEHHCSKEFLKEAWKFYETNNHTTFETPCDKCGVVSKGGCFFEENGVDMKYCDPCFKEREEDREY